LSDSNEPSFLDKVIEQQARAVEEPKVATLEDSPRSVSRSRTRADRIYRGLATGAGVITLALLVVIGGFLLIRASEALRYTGFSFFTGVQWQPQATPAKFGILAVLYWTVIIALIALAIAIPLAICIACWRRSCGVLLIRCVK